MKVRIIARFRGIEGLVLTEDLKYYLFNKQIEIKENTPGGWKYLRIKGKRVGKKALEDAYYKVDEEIEIKEKINLGF